MELIQNQYLKILTCSTRANTEKNRKVRFAIAGLLFFAIFAFSFLIQMRKGYFDGNTELDLSKLAFLHYSDYGTVALFSSATLVLITLIITEAPTQRVKWNYYFSSTWFLVCLLIIIAGVSHEIGDGYIATQASIMLCIPALSIVYGNNKELITKLFDLVAVVIMGALVVIAIIQMIVAPFDLSMINQGNIVSGRYLGITRNPNRLGEYAILGVVASAYLMYRKQGALRIATAFVAGICIAQSLMSISRTSMLSILLILIAWIIFEVKRRKITNIVICLLVIVLSSVATYGITTRGTDPLNLYSNINNVIVVHAENDDDTNGISERLKEKTDMDAFSSGRIAIWKMCVQKITWGGNDIKYSYPLRVLNSRGDGYAYVDLMHNTALEFAFRCGWPVGIILFGIELWAFIFCLSVLFGKKEKVTDAKVFCVFGILVFLVAGNIEPINEAFVRLTLLIFYFSIIPLFSFAADFDIAESFKKIKGKKTAHIEIKTDN